MSSRTKKSFLNIFGVVFCREFTNKNSFDAAKSVIQSYSQVLSNIKGSLTPHQKNWEEFSLKIYAKGLTTTPIPIKRKNYFDALDLNINMVEHKLKIFCGGERLSIDLEGQSQMEFAKEIKSVLENLQIEYKIADKKFTTSDFGEYSKQPVEEIWAILREVYFSMLQFKGDKLEEVSNINFWPHHFDLAMLMFNGKLISDQDPANWDYSREQMNFGLSFGDSDGDGRTNGEDLQDPNGLWKIGDPPPGDPNLVTLPGVADITGVDDATPNKFALLQNYPNPFNPSTTIEYIIPQNSFVSLKIYNITGREITTIVNTQQSAGTNVAVWNGKDKRGYSAASGMYLYRIKAGNNIAVKKMMPLK